ncbi:MAG: hypothetical protein GF421_02730 [Candidatus Aminicenantes bacterium]|nr:hypothetical protein [Candidatus Aminicenantes bacterium]
MPSDKSKKKKQMKDKGKIISLEGPLAQVELNCLSGCQRCAVRHICSDQEQEKGLIQVLNPLKANPGDEVMIEIPENRYSRVLIILFGFLLLASVCGMFLGSLASDALSIPLSTGALLGFFLGLIVTGFGLFSYFKNRQTNLYPEITNIIKKGD